MTPGRDDLGGLIGAFDEWADQQLDQIRGIPRVDQLMRWASEVGDFSVIWHVINLARSGSRGRWNQLLALSLALAVESLVLNQGIKRLFRRPRPTGCWRRSHPGSSTLHIGVSLRPCFSGRFQCCAVKQGGTEGNRDLVGFGHGGGD
jgi:hypothetical protein